MEYKKTKKCMVVEAYNAANVTCSFKYCIRLVERKGGEILCEKDTVCLRVSVAISVSRELFTGVCIYTYMLWELFCTVAIMPSIRVL